VFNIEVEGDDRYFVSQEEVLSHNTRPCAGAANTTTGGKRAKLKSHPDAQGDHTVFKTNDKGQVTHHQEFNKPKDPRNSNKFEPSKRVDTQHSNPHTHHNKATGQDVPTPHAHDPNTPGGIRSARPDELPR